MIQLEQAVDILRREGVVGVPTETVYGLAGRADSEKALHLIFATKQRPFFDPLIVHVRDLNQAATLWRNPSPLAARLAKAFWPGPLTLIDEKQAHVSPLITSGLTTVAVRCPRHPLALELIARVGPLAAPSANLFGRTSPTTAEHVAREFGGQVPVLDGGPCEVGVESTVAQITDTQIKILRPGAITRSQLEEALRGTRHTITREESAASPGHLKAHYQPASPVFLLENHPWTPELRARAEALLHRPLRTARELRLDPDPTRAARSLYQQLRKLSTDTSEAIYVVRTPMQHGELWDAIWDRLERAASHVL